MAKKREKIFLVDGNSLCYRAFYAIRDLATSKGMPTNSIYGVINMLHKIMREHGPDMMAFAFDTKGPTERHKKFAEYKIQRRPMPDELVSQLPYIKEVIRAHNIPVYELDGHEADDVLATLAIKAKKKGYEVCIVTGDKDALQLVDDDVKVLSPHPAEEKLYGREEVVEKFGVEPADMTELMAFMGDASDNVPGAEGVGPVTAVKLVKKYGTVREVYRNLDGVSPESLREKLEDNRDKVLLSRSLVTLEKDLPVEFDAEASRVRKPDVGRLAALYKELEFRKLLKEIMPEEEKEAARLTVLAGAAAEEAVGRIRKAGAASFRPSMDAEGKVEGVSFSAEKGVSFLLDLPRAKEILSDKNILKIGHDLKKDILDLGKAGLEPAEPTFDVMIASYLLEPSLSAYDLSSLAMRELDYDLSSSAEEADVVLRIYEKIKDELKNKKLDKLFHEIEMPLARVLAAMEREGVKVDLAYVKEMAASMERDIGRMTEKIYELAGERFNINSPKQLGVILFGKIGLVGAKKTKTGFSTDESVLVKLAEKHPLPSAILGYRTLAKLKATYCDSIVELADAKTGFLRTHFNQAATATGRLSSSEPNLQNIPIKDEIGRRIRKSFIPEDPSRLLISADYSQVELRVLAHLSHDENLLRAFKEDVDVHAFTASLILGVPINDVDDKMRQAAKTVNFGIIYGMGPFRLAKQLGIDVKEAESFINSYFERYAGVKRFIDGTIASARERGFVTTLLNRRRYLPEIDSRNEQVKAFAERAAVNTPVQGSAADVIKAAMLAVSKEFAGTSVKMILQVHDELVFTAPRSGKKETAEKIKSVMENVMKLAVPLKVTVETGENWMEMEEVKTE